MKTETLKKCVRKILVNKKDIQQYLYHHVFGC